MTALAVIVTSLLVIAGATFAGSDWSTGSMSNQLLFVPRRSTVWLAKALAVLLGGLLVAGVLVVGFWLTLLLVADARGISTPGDVLADVRWLAARSILLAAAAGPGRLRAHHADAQHRGHRRGALRLRGRRRGADLRAARRAGRLVEPVQQRAGLAARRHPGLRRQSRVRPVGRRLPSSPTSWGSPTALSTSPECSCSPSSSPGCPSAPATSVETRVRGVQTRVRGVQKRPRGADARAWGGARPKRTVERPRDALGRGAGPNARLGVPEARLNSPGPPFNVEGWVTMRGRAPNWVGTGPGVE